MTTLTSLLGKAVARTDPTAQMKTILVPADGSGASMEAVALACNIAKRNKGKVYVVYVIEVRRSLPLDADLSPETEKGEGVLRQAETIAHDMDFEVEGELLQAREAGHAVVDEATERKADLVIVGVEYDLTFGGFHLGTVAQYVLRNAPCHVWIWRHR